MINKLIICKMDHKYLFSGHMNTNEESIITAHYENNELVELTCEKEDQNKILNNIYIGKVKNIVPNIQAAFIEIAEGIICYYSFEDNKNPIFINKKANNKIREGDELLVQVSKENVKTKAAVVTSNLSFTGKYMVLTTGNTRIGVSNKLSGAHKKRLLELVKPYGQNDFGFIIRTNASEASDEQIIEETGLLIKKYYALVETARFRTCFSLLHKALPVYLTGIRDIYEKNLDSIITDDPDLYESIKKYLIEEQVEDLSKLIFYEDTLLSLNKLYNLEPQIKDALKDKVWLKSGAYLIIQQTEAFVVVDVNTGKYTGKKNLQETFLKINLEAAKEIARQLRLRNLSGIIVIDFIDMDKKENQNILLEQFGNYLSKDRVKTTLVGMSKLHLVEVTRKKVRKPLYEQMTISCPSCGGRGYLY